jgi:hypothetical protein
VLNTHFLTVILKCIRQSPATLSMISSTSANPSAPNTVLLTTLTHCRTMAATALAMFIRYATFIAAPHSKAREEHILPCLTSLIREGSGTNVPANKKLDAQLKRRLIAAVGELVFYIASQDEGQYGPEGNQEEKWVVGDDVVLVILLCLRDDTDEIVRHYAAKVKT